MVRENCSVAKDMTSKIPVLESPRKTHFASSVWVVEKDGLKKEEKKKKKKTVSANQGHVECLYFVAGQSEMITDIEGKRII